MALTRSLPVNDKNFSGSSTITSRQKPFKDIDLSFEVKPGVILDDGTNLKGDIYKKVDISSLFQALKNILLTNKGEKPFQPEYGSDLSKVLFDNMETYDDLDIKELISNAVSVYEPRIIIDDIEIFKGGDSNILKSKKIPSGKDKIIVDTDKQINTLTITIVFTIRNTQEQVTFTTVLNRLR